MRERRHPDPSFQPGRSTLILDEREMGDNLALVRCLLPQASIWYSVKANSHPRVLRLMHRAGCGFHVSSPGELKRVLKIAAGSPLVEIAASDPVNIPELIRLSIQHRAAALGFDSTGELDKLAAFGASTTPLVLRLAVKETGNSLPVASLGARVDDVPTLLSAVQRRGLRFGGFTFHVGSNCRDSRAWLRALEVVAKGRDHAALSGLETEVINLGGGLPEDPGVAEEILGEIAAALGRFGMDTCRIVIEPGRYLVASAGTMYVRVTGVVRRGQRWTVHVDVGVYNGLHEAGEGGVFSIQATGSGEIVVCDIVGPTCSAFDTIARSVALPLPTPGEFLRIHPAGAYTSTAVTTFCQLAPPRVVFRS